MTYYAIVAMARSAALRGRIMACAAAEGIPDPETWTDANIWKIVASAGWGDDWQYAEDNYQVNQNRETGERTDVIGDSKILAAVQALYNP